MSPTTIEQIARVCHETNRAWCAANGDLSQPTWDAAEKWQRDSTFAAVTTAQAGASPAEQHQAWIDTRIADGWVYGEAKDVEAKTHPCLVPYDELPPEQRIKDSLFIAVVSTLSRISLVE